MSFHAFYVAIQMKHSATTFLNSRGKPFIATNFQKLCKSCNGGKQFIFLSQINTSFPFHIICLSGNAGSAILNASSDQFLFNPVFHSTQSNRKLTSSSSISCEYFALQILFLTFVQCVTCVLSKLGQSSTYLFLAV